MGFFLFFFIGLGLVILFINSFKKTGNSSSASNNGIQPTSGDTWWPSASDDMTNTVVASHAATDYPSSPDSSNDSNSSSYDSSYDSSSSDSGSYDSGSSSSDSSSSDSSSSSSD